MYDYHHIQLLFMMIAFVLLSLGCTHKQPAAFSRGVDTAPIECKIPMMYIQMDSADCESIHRNRNANALANLLLIASGDTLYDGEVHIKTRGNISWTLCGNKKPYSIKFPEKQRLFQMDKGKSYVLLTNILNGGGILQNSIAFELGKTLGLPSPPDAVFLRLYMNGDYRGLYQMTNKVEIGAMGIRINNLNKQNKRLNDRPLDEYPFFQDGRPYKPGHRKGVSLPNESEDCTGGYVLDATMWKSNYKDISGFVSDSGSMIRIREPKYATRREVEYIADYFNQMEKAIREPDDIHPSKKKKFDEYLDVTSFARYYILQEIMQNGDAGINSFFMYKDVDDVDGKMYAGPVWDFDWLLREHDNDLWACARLSGNGDLVSSGGLLHFLWQHDTFQQQAKYDYFNILLLILTRK